MNNLTLKEQLIYLFSIFIVFNLVYLVNANESFSVSHGIDSDKDGISDKFESEGIDINNDEKIDLHLKELGAKPNHKDLFVEMDYMSTYKPSEDAKNLLIDAFNKGKVTNPDGTQGINLHLIIDQELRYNEFIKISDIEKIKSENFGTGIERVDSNFPNIKKAKSSIFHYGIFANKILEYPLNTGIGFHVHPMLRHPTDLPPIAMEFVVALGPIKEKYGPNSITADIQASTLMHELGHNLGLTHAGDHINNDKYQPNYFSVMNYLFQLGQIPLKPNPLDYSSCKIDLHEGALNELKGIEDCISLPFKRPSAFQTEINCLNDNAPPKRIKTNSQTNWNSEGGFQTIIVQHDFNCNNTFEPVKSSNDWEYLCLICDTKNQISFSPGEGLSESIENENEINRNISQFYGEELSVNDIVSIDNMNLEYIKDLIKDIPESTLRVNDSAISASPAGLAESMMSEDITHKDVLLAMLGGDSSTVVDPSKNLSGITSEFETINKINDSSVYDALTSGNIDQAIDGYEKVKEYGNFDPNKHGDVIDEIEGIAEGLKKRSGSYEK
jgi:hypothetical protein